MNKVRFAYNFMEFIEIEISSLCNRKCDYCPQMFLQRKRELFPYDVFERIMKELSELQFEGWIAFHQYNEPLLEYDYLCKCIKCVKEYVPLAKLELFTNGDFLTKEKYLVLKELGITKFNISCHCNHNEQWSEEFAKEKINKMVNILKLNGGIYSYKEDLVSFSHEDRDEKEHELLKGGYKKPEDFACMTFIFSKNFMESGSTRMHNVEVKQHDPNTIRDHQYYCRSLLRGLEISYKGNVFLCCDCCEDAKEASKYIIGSVLDESICDLFAKKEKLMYDYIQGNELPCCVDCYWNIVNF